MQTHKPANSYQLQKKMAQPKSDEQSFQLAIDSAPSFVDSRTQAVQLATLQSIARQSPQQQQFLTLQAKMTSAYSAPSFFQESQSELKSSQVLNNSASAVPVQRLANKHGMTPAKLKQAAGYSVYGWGRLIANDGSFVDLTPSKAENGQHAEDYLMEEAYAILELNPDGYSGLQIWVTSSPCSTTFGTSDKDEGCHEELNEMPEQYPISLDVFATKAYQPKGVKGGKKASVDAMTSDSNINYAVDNKSGVAKTLNLQKYTVPADLAPLGNSVIQLANQANSESKSEVTKSNKTGLPDNLKSGIENLSGYAMDDVTVHYNSEKPAQLNAHAYAQGTDIHVAPGQEQHLPHEAWHVVQQKQGRVQPTMQMKAGIPVNDDAGLEHEADVMGAKALTSGVITQRVELQHISAQNASSSIQGAFTTFPVAHVGNDPATAHGKFSEYVSVIEVTADGKKFKEEYDRIAAALQKIQPSKAKELDGRFKEIGIIKTEAEAINNAAKLESFVNYVNDLVVTYHLDSAPGAISSRANEDGTHHMDYFFKLPGDDAEKKFDLDDWSRKGKDFHNGQTATATIKSIVDEVVTDWDTSTSIVSLLVSRLLGTESVSGSTSNSTVSDLFLSSSIGANYTKILLAAEHTIGIRMADLKSRGIKVQHWKKHTPLIKDNENDGSVDWPSLLKTARDAFKIVMATAAVADQTVARQMAVEAISTNSLLAEFRRLRVLEMDGAKGTFSLNNKEQKHGNDIYKAMPDPRFNFDINHFTAILFFEWKAITDLKK